MAPRKKIGLRDVRSLGAGQIIWDSSVAGFGARRQKGDAVSYVLFFRTAEGRQRWVTIGKHGAPWTPDMARDKARELLGEVTRGVDPAAIEQAKRKAATVAELCDIYQTESELGRLLTRRKETKRPSTIASDKGRIERHIKPLLGSMKVTAVTREDIEGFMAAVAEGKSAQRKKSGNPRGLAIVKGGKTAASRTVGLLGAIFTYSVRRRMRPDNPVHGVARYADGKRDRRLSETEYRVLGEMLRLAERDKVWPAAVQLARFLAVTGWRKGEGLELRWRDIDMARRTATLQDTKTGRSLRPLSHAACDILSAIPRGKDDALVFPATRGDGAMVGFPKLWAKMAKAGKLPSGITIHVLRHSFASLAADLGFSEPTIAALVGHKGRSMTSRYVHSADAVLLAAADAVANRTTELMGVERTAAEVVPLRR